MLIVATLALCAGFLLDLLVGDPHGLPHLVRGFGLVVSTLEKAFYPMKRKRLGGALLVLCTLGLCAGAPALLLLGAWRLSPWVYFAFETLLCWQVLAIKDLKDESLAVYLALMRGDLPAARAAVSRIVGRDTARLDRFGVTRATVETVAENVCDGVVAPLLYLALGGAALGCLYKAVNTMDSMIGYRNDRYLDFGRAAARLDDAFNFLPARLAALLLLAAARPCGLDAASAFSVWKRDRRKHASPNSAQTEAVMAGALRVLLGGDAVYFGKLHQKPAIGDDLRPIEPADILRAHRMLYAAAWSMLGLALLFRGVLHGLL